MASFVVGASSAGAASFAVAASSFAVVVPAAVVAYSRHTAVGLAVGPAVADAVAAGGFVGTHFGACFGGALCVGGLFHPGRLFQRRLA